MPIAKLPSMVAASLLMLVAGASGQSDWKPGATLADDIAKTDVKLVEGYAAKHPRLLFGEADKKALADKAKAKPELWKNVLESSRRLGTVPDADLIKTGKKYWQIERVQAGALAWFVTGDKKHLDGARSWMIPHAQEAVWGTDYRPNLDLQASWYLYHIALAYDIAYDGLAEADRKIIRDGLTLHAKALYDSFDPATAKDKFRYDQNHTYIPAVALTTAALALQGEVPEAADWLKRAVAVMNRCRYALGSDGYYYEGYGYWTYALHWHVRYADMMSRATGQKLHEIPFLRDNWRFGLYLSLPGAPGGFDVGDINRPAKPDEFFKTTNSAMYWGLASANQSGESRAAGDLYASRGAENDYPSAAFLWSTDAVAPTPLEKIPAYFHFNDSDVVSWRSGWGPDATAVLFRSGPPEGHKTAQKLKEMTDWTINAGHVHPDIGAFYLYAKGEYLAVGTGYTAEKRTGDHNTLLIDGKGQGNDGTYWNDRGVPYEQFDGAKIDQVHLSDQYGFASGTIGSAYTRQVPGVTLRRSVLMRKNYLLLIDDLSANEPHALTWLCHADTNFDADGAAYVAKIGKAKLAVIPLKADLVDAKSEPKTVMAGTAPGKGAPTQHGFELSLTTKAPAKSVRLATLVIPLGAGDEVPTIASSSLDGDAVKVSITWPKGGLETIELNLGWKMPAAPDAANPGPARFAVAQ
jgi:hypothetical protein